eukprot:1120081-Rhodomonas_salina.3
MSTCWAQFWNPWRQLPDSCSENGGGVCSEQGSRHEMRLFGPLLVPAPLFHYRETSTTPVFVLTIRPLDPRGVYRGTPPYKDIPMQSQSLAVQLATCPRRPRRKWELVTTRWTQAAVASRDTCRRDCSMQPFESG